MNERLTDEEVDRMLSAVIPGGSQARDWFLPHASHKGLANVRDVVRAMYAAVPAVQPIPEGWKLVPVEPTEEMWTAGRDPIMYRDVKFHVPESMEAPPWRINPATGKVERDQSKGTTAVHVWRAMLAAAPQAPAVQPKWQPIETAPKDGRTLLLGHFNSRGKWRTVRGQWFSADAIAESWEEPDDCDEGWYETTVECDDMPNCWATDPTHWMPLPAAPHAEAWQEQPKQPDSSYPALPEGQEVTAREAEWDGSCALGHCGWPSGCENDGQCRAAGGPKP